MALSAKKSYGAPPPKSPPPPKFSSVVSSAPLKSPPPPKFSSVVTNAPLKPPPPPPPKFSSLVTNAPLKAPPPPPPSQIRDAGATTGEANRFNNIKETLPPPKSNYGAPPPPPPPSFERLPGVSIIPGPPPPKFTPPPPKFTPPAKKPDPQTPPVVNPPQPEPEEQLPPPPVFAEPVLPTPPPPPPPPAKIKVAPIDTVLFNDDAVPAEIIADLLFEQIGGQELLTIARNDTVNGQSVLYQPIKNIDIIQQQYNSNNLLRIRDTIGTIFGNFAIRLSEKIPQVGNGPSGSNIYLDAEKNIVIEFININPDEQVEIQITSSGTIYEVG